MHQAEPGRAAGVVDEDVDLTETLDGGIDARLDLGLDHDVAGDEVGTVAAGHLGERLLTLLALRPLSMTQAPLARKASAMPRPMPRVPPVTNATLPSRSIPELSHGRAGCATLS